MFINKYLLKPLYVPGTVLTLMKWGKRQETAEDGY